MNEYENKKTQLTLLQKGNGLQYILNEAYRILHKPVITHDMDYNVLAYTENVVFDDPIWLEFVNKGTVGQDRLEFYKDENFFEVAANTKKVTLLISDKLKYDRMYGKLFSGDGIQIGCACMTEFEERFCEYDILLFETLCDILNDEIATDAHFSDYARQYQEKLICELIENTEVDRELYTAHVESLYIGLGENLYLSVVKPEHGAEPCTVISAVCDLLRRDSYAFKYARYNEYIIVIISSGTPLKKGRDFGKLEEVLRQNNAHMGLSEHFGNLFELNARYYEAVSALNAGLYENNKRIMFYIK